MRTDQMMSTCADDSSTPIKQIHEDCAAAAITGSRCASDEPPPSSVATLYLAAASATLMAFATGELSACFSKAARDLASCHAAGIQRMKDIALRASATAGGVNADLWAAAAEGRTEMVKRLVKEGGADVNAKNEEGHTPLVLAVMGGHVETAVALRSLGGQSLSKDGSSVLHIAASRGHAAVIDALAERADPNLSGAQLQFRVRLNRVHPDSTVNLPNAKGETASMFAVQNDHFDALRSLVEKGANLEIPHPRSGKTALYTAVEKGNIAAVKALLELGASATTLHDCHMPLHDAALKGKMDVVKVLVEWNRDLAAVPSTGQTTPMMFAAIGGRAEIITYFAECGASVDAIDHCGTSALHYAAACGVPRAVTELLRLGASVNRANHQGESAILVAAGKGHLEVVAALIDAGADVNTPDPVFGVTPLMKASMHGSKDLVELLVKNGAAIDAVTRNGCTALHLAALYKRYDAYEALKRLGARDSRNDEGQTVQDCLDMIVYVPR